MSEVMDLSVKLKTSHLVKLLMDIHTMVESIIIQVMLVFHSELSSPHQQLTQMALGLVALMYCIKSTIKMNSSKEVLMLFIHTPIPHDEQNYYHEIRQK
jgi:hypothetical protein